MDDVIIIGYKTYEFTNDDKQIVSGSKISYISKTGRLVENEVGHLPIQVTVPIEFVKTLKEIPGLYKPVYSVVPGKNNKPQLSIVNFEFIKKIDLVSLYKSGNN